LIHIAAHLPKVVLRVAEGSTHKEEETTTPVPTDLNISVPAIETNVQTGQSLFTSCENHTIPKAMHTPA
jgi:hypothetical protein